MKIFKWSLGLILIVLIILYTNRHYLFSEVPQFAKSFDSGKQGKAEMENDSIALISHKLMDEFKAKAGTKLSEDVYIGMEKELTTCVKNSIKGVNTNDLDLKQFVDTYFRPCIERSHK